MKISPHWLREFVDLKVDDRRLAEDLTAAGIAVESISGQGADVVFEMEIGTNRPDAMNHYGVAREAAVIYDLPLKLIAPKLPAATATLALPIEITEPDLCPRFTGRVIRKVHIKPSSEKMVRRLALLDQRAINNAADATNYVLWEIGKPTHVFDLDLLEGGRIIVRRAKEGELLKTLDGVERKLSADDLVIADARKPVALAGVMGGYDTMITEKTRNILIESAWFDPVTIRKTSRRHGLHTDASHRFERGADFESTVLSCDRVAELILETGGGELGGGVVDVIAKHIDLAPIALHISEMHRILGKEVSTQQIYRILTKLGFEMLPEVSGELDFTVRVPSWRLDVEREIDLIEEVARLHGYDKFPNTLPAFAGAVIELPDAAKDAALRSSLLALGYNEAVSLSFISHDDAETFSASPVIELANPLSEEASVMRTSMVPGMLDMLAFNLNRGIDNVRLFEAGGIFELAGTKPLELKRICVGATGSAVPGGVHEAARPFSFFDLKGDLETLLKAFDSSTLYFDAHIPEYYHPGRSARAVLDGTTVAQFGQIHPDVAARRKLRQEVFVAELFLDRLYRRALRKVQYQALPKYPAVERDFSFLFGDDVTFENVQQAVIALNLSELRAFVPVEIFRGGKVPAGKYSILLRVTFQSGDRTLREEEVTQWSSAIVQALEALGGRRRT
ncbi:MAG TPA: phenylalanine--tRNA ligase subunit beta [Terriglobales bacterium]|nr:phenylalanine--tRNA ligase subunit beta [Terriglobales bacterium]